MLEPAEATGLSPFGLSGVANSPGHIGEFFTKLFVRANKLIRASTAITKLLVSGVQFSQGTGERSFGLLELRRESLAAVAPNRTTLWRFPAYRVVPSLKVESPSWLT
jgi:hypothetical protein